MGDLYFLLEQKLNNFDLFLIVATNAQRSVATTTATTTSLFSIYYFWQ